NTCFNGTSTSCHGSSGAKNIQSVISRTYKHPTTTTSGAHTNLDVLFPLGGTPIGSKGLDWVNSRHGECVDCHNSHQATQGSHTPANQWYPSTVSATTNNVSNSGALTGVTGVQPGTQPLWTVITSYTTQKDASKEYQICFKCHSYYALQDPDGVTVYTTASSATVTDQAREFSPGNKSAHPVEVTLNNMLTGSGGTTTPGSYTPKPLVTAQMSAPWNVSGTVGNQTMYCSDCHGADSESTSDPKGPHGSNSKYMLKGSRKYWPLNSSLGLWTLADIQNNTNNWSTNLFCVNCHPIYSGSTWQNNVHSRGNHQATDIYCISCHVVVPHGSKRSRLIGYATDTPPYNYNGAGTYEKLVVCGRAEFICKG
ncbi:MAG: cytochrome C, partial [Nitrospirae bacterium]|nr:cytochrome C [Nitrospirota bacterium]